MKYILLCFLLVLPSFGFAQSKEVWIESLHQCESQGRDEITVLDSNHKYSYGGLQFQLDTFMSFGKLYNILPEELTNKEGLLLIHTFSIQKAIAREMLDDGLQKNWLNCVKKIGYYPLTSDS